MFGKGLKTLRKRPFENIVGKGMVRQGNRLVTVGKQKKTENLVVQLQNSSPLML